MTDAKKSSEKVGRMHVIGCHDDVHMYPIFANKVAEHLLRGVIGKTTYQARDSSSGRAYDFDLTNMALSNASADFHALVDMGRYVGFHRRSVKP